MQRIFLTLLSLILIGQTETAGAAQWKLDPAHTNFFFETKHIYSTIRGQFTGFSGEIVFDPAHPEEAKFDFEVKVDSVNTLNEKRDGHLRTGEFFDASKFPVMTFKSSRVKASGEKTFIVEGKLTIKDVTKDMALEFVYNGQKEHPLQKGETVAGLDCRLSIDRLDFHVGDGKFYKMGVLGKAVDILISIEMLKKS